MMTELGSWWDGKFNPRMCTINKQKELCEDRIVTWDQTKCSNYDHGLKISVVICLETDIIFSNLQDKGLNKQFSRILKQK